MSTIIEKIFNSPQILDLQKRYISVFQWVLKKCGYNLYSNPGTNNFTLNFLDFMSLVSYCVLSSYNIFKTFNVSIPPSYLMFTLNLLCLLRLYLGNDVRIRDAKNRYLQGHQNESDQNIHIRSTTIISVLEILCLIASIIFIMAGRVFNENIFGVSSASAVAWISLAIIVFTFVEGFITIGVNMFQASPLVYIRQKEGEEEC